jgi:uncharacterized membrane protein
LVDAMLLERTENMWSLADRMVKAVSDITVGTVIVLVHVALADRTARKQTPRMQRLSN